MDDAARYERQQAVFERARRLSGAAREGFLDEVCAGDERLRAEVGALLAADAGHDALSEERLARERSALDRAFEAGLAGPSPAAGAGPDAAPGARIRQYRILHKLGEGGMGEVFEAFDEILKRKVALKTIGTKKALRPGTLERLRREARTLSKLDHPRVCRIFDYLEGAERDYLVLEYVEGRTVADALEAGLSRPAAWRIAEQVTEALVAAHAAGVVHRDLKPANLMVTPAGDVKVLDFGLARLEQVDEASLTAELESASSRLLRAPEASGRVTWGLGAQTQAGTLLGTPLYMSPEQARGEVVGAPSDLYSLGLVLHELFTGQGVYPRGLPLVELLDRVRRGVTQPAPGLDRDLLRLLGSLLDPMPFNRPTAVEALARLRSIRAKPRRRWRLAGVAVLGLAALGAWAKYTIDLRRREQQAENLIDYLVDDLRQQLVPLGKLELLAGLGHKALEYFQAVPESDWTEAELEHRCTAFYQLGEVLLQQGDSAGASEFFEAALSYARDMTRRRPDSAEWLFQRAQCEFYVGQVAFERGAFDEARPWLEAYGVTADALHALAPGSVEYRMEQIYARTNLGALAQKQGRLEEGTQILEAVVASWRELADLAPDDPERAYELADALSWLAEVLGQRLELVRTMECLEQEAALRADLAGRGHEDPRRKYTRAIGLFNLARAVHWQGDSSRAARVRGRAIGLARDLVQTDPTNRDWQRLLGMVLVAQARQGAFGGDWDEARLLGGEALRIFEELLALDALNEDWQYLTALARLTRAQVLLATGEPRSAARLAQEALALEQEGHPWRREQRLALELEARSIEFRSTPGEARSVLQSVLSESAGVAIGSEALFLRAHVLRWMGDERRAEEEGRELLQRGYSDPWKALLRG